MSGKPILFSGPLVRAILAGAKTQTRRLPRRRVERLGTVGLTPDPAFIFELGGTLYDEADALAKLKAHPVGTELWVREAFGWIGPGEAGGNFRCPPPSATRAPGSGRPRGAYIIWRADYPVAEPDVIGGWRPSIHMPRWASRITLRVTGVRLERLRAITDGDIRAEGIEHAGMVAPGQSLRDAWALGWDSINGGRETEQRPTTWARNPWVIVYDFERLEDGR